MALSQRVLDRHIRNAHYIKTRWQALLEPFNRWRAIRARQRFCATYIGITGSCGKTTTAHLLGAMLAAYGATATGKLRNTPPAIYRTLRKLRAPVDFVVQEISGHVGKERLLSLATELGIDVALVTAVGREHWANFDSEAAIAEAKGQLAAALRPEGLACLNADDPHVRAIAAMTTARVVLFGRSPDAEVRAEAVAARWPNRLSFDLVIGERRQVVHTRFVGTLMLTNILGALSVVDGLGLPLEPALAVLAATEPVFEHMSVHDSERHSFVLDTDKAPLWSTLMLINDLPSLRGGRTVVVLSQISEMGGTPSAKYRRLIRQVAGAVDEVVVLGKAAQQGIKLVTSGELTNVTCLASVAEAYRHIAAMPPSLVLVKSAAIDRLVRLWLATEGPVSCERVTCNLKIACSACAMLRPRAAPAVTAA
jgi:UDP-N-acetylmuramoyl-tripeptide--D-alanyl-D-alanine ligase